MQVHRKRNGYCKQVCDVLSVTAHQRINVRDDTDTDMTLTKKNFNGYFGATVIDLNRRIK